MSQSPTIPALSPAPFATRRWHFVPLFAGLFLALYLFSCFYYVLGSTLGGHGESSVICTAWVFIHGHPLYPAPDAAERYAMVYGPMEALFNGSLFWLFGPHLLPVRLAGAGLAIVGLFCCWKVFRRLGNQTIAAAGIGWLALVYLKYTIITFYARPDTQLQLCISLTLFAAIVARGAWAWLLFGIALAWGIDLKITMPIYAFPLIPLFWQRHGFRALGQSLLVAIFLTPLPFLIFPQISVSNFFKCLFTAVDEGTERAMIIPVGGYLGLLSLPALCPIALLALRHPSRFKALLHRHRWFGICAALTIIAVLRITGKPGAGPSHLLPLFPILGMVAVKSLMELLDQEQQRRISIRPKATAAIISTAVLFLLIMVGFAARDLWVNIFQAYPWSTGKAWVAEIEQLADRYPHQGLSMGVGSSRENYASTRYQPLLVLRNNPYLLDVPAMMDMQKAGHAIPHATRDYIAQGKCPLWLIPRGEAPFELRNWYEPHGMIFDDTFRRIFQEHYRIIDHSPHFDVWAYHP